MNEQELRLRVRQFIENNFPLARSKPLSDDASLLDSGIVDSIGVLDIVTFLETELNVLPTDDEMLADNFESIDAITAFAHQKQQATLRDAP